MRIPLNFQDVETRGFEVTPTSTIRALKERVSIVIGIPTHQFWFSSETKILQNANTFEQEDIQDGEELYVEGVIDRVLPVYQPVPVYHPAGGEDTLQHAGNALQSNLAKLRGLLLEWKGLTPPDRTEAPTFGDYWWGRDDPRVAELEAELRIANLSMTALQAQKGELEARIKVLELQLSKDPEAIKARREQENREIQARIDARKETDRVRHEQA